MQFSGIHDWIHRQDASCRVGRAVACAFVLVGLLADVTLGQTVLMVIDWGAPNYSESARISLFESWGYTVTTITDGASQTSFDAAVAGVDVVYVPSTIDDYQLQYKLRTASVGVVTETPGLDTEFGFATGDGFTESSSQVWNVDNSHAVTSGLSAGTVTIFSSSTSVATNGNTLAAGMQVLGERSFGQLGLGVIEAGGMLANSHLGDSTASGRRVRLPWGGSVNISLLNSNGLTLLKNAMSWASGLGELLGHWRLDEASGTTAVDSSEHSRDGSVTGTVVWTSGRYQNALDLDKTNQVSIDGLMGQPTDFTISCWANTRTSDTSGSQLVSVGDHFEILSHYNAYSYNAPVAAFHDGSGYIIVEASGGSRVGTGWHHYAATFDDASNELKIYVDGELAGTAATTASIDFSGLGSNTVIGANGNGNPTFDHDGPVDEVRIYSRSLTADEIASLYDLQGHWRLGELNGTTATDASPQNNHGTYTGDVALNQSGPYPDEGAVAATLDGTEDYVVVPNESDYDITEEITVAAWIKVDEFDEGFQAVVAKGDSAWRLTRDNHTDYMHFACNGTSHPFLYGNISVNDGKWHHVAGVYDGSTIKLYVDGVVDVSANSTGLIDTNDQPVMLGRNVEHDWRDWNGGLHDARVYNRALSDSEISELYGLVGHWKMDEGAGSTAADSTGYSNDATLNGAIWTSDCAGNSGLEFDGSGVTATTGASFDPPERGAVAFWFRSAGAPNSMQHLWGVGTNYEMWQDSDGLISMDVSTDGYQGGFITTEPLYREDRWYHLVAEYDSDDDSYSIYVNGELHKSGISTWAMTKKTASTLTFGTRTGSAQYFEGALRDFRIYNRPLSGIEISDLSGLAGYWRLDESSGTVAVDSSTNGNDGTYTNGVLINQTGNVLQAADFDGADDYVGVPDHATLQMNDVFSISGWIRADASSNVDRMILNKEGEYELALSPDGELKWGLTNTDPGWSWHDTGHIVALGKWVHVALTYDNGEVVTYANGVPVDTYSGSGVIGDQYTLLNELRIGGRSNNPSGKYFHGRIDDVRVFKRVLCPVEVFDSYRGGRPGGVRILQWVEVR